MTLKNWRLRIVSCLVLALMVSLPRWCFAEDSSTWLVYDEGEAVHESSGFQFQGVRFSLPDEVVRAPLITVRFFYKTTFGFCPVTIHITAHDHRSELAPPFYYNAVNGWNNLDISTLGITVPHNFYIILENTGCGSPMLDDGIGGERSFKGLYLDSLTTLFSQNLLIQSEVGSPMEIPVFQEWNVSVNEKITIKLKKEKAQKIRNTYEEIWTLYEDGSFEMEDGPFGVWLRKGKKFLFLLDPEDIKEHIEGSLDLLGYAVNKILVTKSSFAGKVKKSGDIKGTWKSYSSIGLEDIENTTGKIIIETKYTASSTDF